MALMSLSLRKTLLWALSSAALAACGSSSDAPSSSSDSSVVAAYGALVSDAAQCADKVTGCLEAAGTDQTKWMTCRDDYKTCRDNAGAKAEMGLGAAVTVCTAKHRECAKAEKGGNQSCSDELSTCLSSVHGANKSDDADAGAEHASGDGGRKHDCIDELKSCVEGDTKPGECAHAARQCVVKALPDVDVIAPMRNKGKDSSGDTHGAGGSTGEHTKPEGAGGSGGSDESGDDSMSGSTEHEGEARMCVKTFAGCVDDGDARECASKLRTCTETLTP